jgi:protein-S-isoprenylcysteine O-methyltransferase Ste14
VPYLVIWLRPGPEVVIPGPLVWLGVGLTIAGIAVAIWAARALGRHFDVEVQVHQGHEVIRSGPYGVVRHPIYSGLGLHYLGACLATGNLLLLAGTLAVTFPGLYLRARAEEDLLRTELGPAYDRYAREVPMLVPVPGRRG